MKKLIGVALLVFAASFFILSIQGKGWRGHDHRETSPVAQKNDTPFSRATNSVVSNRISGKPTIIDADTIEIRQRRVRLYGIDAVEADQLCFRGNLAWRCGLDAINALDRMIEGREIQCEERDRDRYHRIIASCRLGSTDIARWLVETGWAVAYRRFSEEYVVFEEQARRGRVGIWTSNFEDPEQWRRRRRN
jgi:endonuclease YncB( thermonuclease family)